MVPRIDDIMVYVYNLRQSTLETNKVDLEKSKWILRELHRATSEIFKYAWAQGFHRELAEYAMTLKENVPGGQ